MKKIIHLLILLFISVVGFAQTNPKDFLGINLNDSLHPLTIDSAKIEKKADTSKKTKSAYYPGMELHPHIPKAYTIDKGRAVGEIPFTTTTTSTGAMVINIPIDVPKDDNNYAPQLALGYNSNGVNSTLGIGWSISGVSQIVRTNKTVYYDGRTEGVKFGSDNAYCKDYKEWSYCYTKFRV